MMIFAVLVVLYFRNHLWKLGIPIITKLILHFRGTILVKLI